MFFISFKCPLKYEISLFTHSMCFVFIMSLSSITCHVTITYGNGFVQLPVLFNFREYKNTWTRETQMSFLDLSLFLSLQIIFTIVSRLSICAIKEVSLSSKAPTPCLTQKYLERFEFGIQMLHKFGHFSVPTDHSPVGRYLQVLTKLCQFE